MTTLAAPSPRRLPRQLTRLIPGITALILGGVLLGATLARLDNFAAPPAAPKQIAQKALTFSDLASGGVAVRDTVNGQLISTIPARDDGFLRMTLRLLAAARLRQHIGQQQPFLLTEFAGGRMALSDPATGLVIELEAFGPSNATEFAKLLSPACAP